MKKAILTVILAAAALALVACHTSFTYTFTVETGDSIAVELDTTDGLALTQDDGTFYVTRDDETYLTGIFILEDTYDTYISYVEDDTVTLLDEGTQNGNSYYMYTVDGSSGTEYDYVLWVAGSDTGVLMGSLISEDAAREAFESLTITME